MTSRYPFREVKALMVLKGLGLRAVAKKARVPYTAASEILNGRRISAPQLRRLRTAIDTMQEVPA